MAHDPRRKIELLRRTIADAESVVEKPPVGPHQGGLSEYDVLVVAAFHDRNNAERFRGLLRDSKIVSSMRRDQGGFAIEVDVRDRGQAMRLLDEHRKRFKDSVLAVPRLRHTSALAGVAIAFTAGLTICAGSAVGWHYIAMPIGYSLIGGVVGHLFDRMIWRLESNHRLVVRTIDILIAAWVIPLAIYLFYLLPKVLN